MPNLNATKSFFKSLNLSKTNSNISLWTLPTKQTIFLSTTNIQVISDKVITLAEEQDVYCSIALFANPPETGRGKAERASHLIGLFADIDTLEKPDSKGRAYAPNKEVALSILNKISTKPTFVTDSGYGLHVLYLFPEPLLIRDAAHIKELEPIYKGFQDMLKNNFKLHGYVIDSVADLVRVFRVPGTFNRKDKDNPKPVTILQAHPESRITIDSIRHLAEVAPPKKTLNSTANYFNNSENKNKANAERIRQQCGWFNHFIEDANQLSEPDWYAGLSILGHCENGKKLAHEYSKSYPDYSRSETDNKLEQAITTAGPRSCENIRAVCGAEEYCSICPHWGKITSPIQTGYGNEPKEDEKNMKAKVLKVGKKLNLWKTKNDTAYVTITENGHSENWRLNGDKFYKWFIRKLYLEHNKIFSNSQIVEALAILEATAVYEGKQYEVFHRIAFEGKQLHIDLGDDSWSSIEIRPDGWEIKPEAPVKFIRSDSVQPLPVPDKDGDINLLRKYIPCDSEDDFKLVVGLLLGIFAPRHPYPVGIFTGLQGGGKTTRARAIIKITDPSSAELVNAPSDTRDVLSSASSRWLTSYDNVRKINHGISDVFCSISTGIAHTARQYHTNLDVFETPEIARPQIITGIELRLNQDLRSRSIFFEFSPLKASDCKTEDEYWNEYNLDAPKILGGILNALSCSLRNWDRVKKQKVELPRLADHAQWVSAAEEYLGWKEGTYRALLLAHQKDGMLDSDMNTILGQIIIEYCRFTAEIKASVIHSPTDLFKDLKKWIQGDTARVSREHLRYLPQSPGALGKKLRRLAPSFALFGVTFEFDQNHNGSKRAIKISFSDEFRQINKDDTPF